MKTIHVNHVKLDHSNPKINDFPRTRANISHLSREGNGTSSTQKMPERMGYVIVPRRVIRQKRSENHKKCTVQYFLNRMKMMKLCMKVGSLLFCRSTDSKSEALLLPKNTHIIQLNLHNTQSEFLLSQKPPEIIFHIIAYITL